MGRKSDFEGNGIAESTDFFVIINKNSEESFLVRTSKGPYASLSKKVPSKLTQGQSKSKLQINGQNIANFNKMVFIETTRQNVQYRIPLLSEVYFTKE